MARFSGLVEDLIACAVLADRRSGASCAQVGAALGVTADAARARYGHRRLTVEWPILAAPACSQALLAESARSRSVRDPGRQLDTEGSDGVFHRSAVGWVAVDGPFDGDVVAVDHWRA
ncbi:hypothetical protein [Nocardia brevicatena]|uniref:hypothetical protein n=1 Tax=Nocardia brevicatena TaxID=37327 RepID=UPI0012FAFAD4|nr:hypothetical protein [Nocardia brevicatena]